MRRETAVRWAQWGGPWARARYWLASIHPPGSCARRRHCRLRLRAAHTTDIGPQAAGAGRQAQRSQSHQLPAVQPVIPVIDTGVEPTCRVRDGVTRERREAETEGEAALTVAAAGIDGAVEGLR